MSRNPLRSPGDRDISALYDMYKQGTLRLAPEFQREGVWPQPAKAYLIDTVLSDRPIPLLFFSKVISSHTNRATYDVVDGQQRLRAIFDYMEDKFPLSRSSDTDSRWRGRRYSKLDDQQRMQFLNYDMAISELKNYNQAEIKDVFLRMNKYVVRLNSAEMRRAKESGVFKDFCASVGRQEWWTDLRIITKQQRARLRSEELAAEFAILLMEGPQDKKESVDIYYVKYADDFPDGDEVKNRLDRYVEWASAHIPDFSTSRWRKPVDLYALLGALDVVTEAGELLETLDGHAAGESATKLERDLAKAAAAQRTDPEIKLEPRLARYLTAASSQTDNIQPRKTRTEILVRMLSDAALA
ncbi:DUF262 domain-containing protein [Georgenia subflava]|uniref:DUF262 domain-containing protein n=1 Tax=Georgenia subflava TaxID=1622177 RepID=A0A6N7EC31_9MICO|nr:DUF262 domain-containing protein [Georgenia subflava]MPV35659.1 DUF262 domain-containing protein [Georgenia subflava]